MIPVASIVIPAHNERQYLPGLLESLAPVWSDPAVEIVVFDNGSTDGTAELLKGYPCRLVSTPATVNPSAARNRGVAETRGAVLAFLDADVVVTPQWLDEFRKHRQPLLDRPLTVMGDMYHMSRHPGWIERHWFEPLRTQPAEYFNGGNILTTRLLFDRIGGFDEGLDTGEDVDFCLRASQAGATLVTNAGLVVQHEGFPRTGRAFMRRERWHGRGDWVDRRRFLDSRIAQATVVFFMAHLGAMAALLLGAGGNVVALALGVAAAVCVASALYRFHRDGWRQWVMGTLISYLYFAGRSLSLVDTLGDRLRRRPS